MSGQADLELRGDWRVERLSGLMPPLGVTKRIGVRSGVTTVFGIPLAAFTVSGRNLVYRRLPVQDALAPDGAGGWVGEGRLGGHTFCRFRLVK